MTLQENIEILTREHKTAAHTVDGLEFHTRPALLHLLREAVFGGMESTGGGSALQSRLPISDAALDLYRLIDHQIAEAWAQVHNMPPNSDRPEALAAQWAALVDDERVVTVTHPEQHEKDGKPFVIGARAEYQAQDLARRWVAQIEEFFDPPKRADISEPCIQCGERYVHRRKDGQTVRSAAFSFVRDRKTGETLRAECLACGSWWAPDQFEFLRESLKIADRTIEDKPVSKGVEWRGSVQCAEALHELCGSVHCECDCHAQHAA